MVRLTASPAANLGLCSSYDPEGPGTGVGEPRIGNIATKSIMTAEGHASYPVVHAGPACLGHWVVTHGRGGPASGRSLSNHRRGVRQGVRPSIVAPPVVAESRVGWTVQKSDVCDDFRMAEIHPQRPKERNDWVNDWSSSLRDGRALPQDVGLAN